MSRLVDVTTLKTSKVATAHLEVLGDAERWGKLSTEAFRKCIRFQWTQMRSKQVYRVSRANNLKALQIVFDYISCCASLEPPPAPRGASKRGKRARIKLDGLIDWKKSRSPFESTFSYFPWNFHLFSPINHPHSLVETSIYFHHFEGGCKKIKEKEPARGYKFIRFNKWISNTPGSISKLSINQAREDE